MSKGKILAIDDDPMIRNLLSAILKSDGYDIETVDSGTAAFSWIMKQPQPIKLDLIILDVVMPGLNGLDVLTRLKLHATTAKIPVVMLTGEAKNKDLFSGYNQGAEYYITKPFNKDQLIWGIKLAMSK